MRQKRAKAYKKLMQLYCMSFGFRQPYQVLGQSISPQPLTQFDRAVDAEMCRAAIAQDIELVKQISVVLHGEMKPSASSNSFPFVAEALNSQVIQQ